VDWRGSGKVKEGQQISTEYAKGLRENARGNLGRAGTAHQGVAERPILMAYPVEDFGIEQAPIPLWQQSEAYVALAVPELPRHKLQHVLVG
jgi:hypothetical protein